MCTLLEFVSGGGRGKEEIYSLPSTCGYYFFSYKGEVARGENNKEGQAGGGREGGGEKGINSAECLWHIPLQR